MFYNILFYIFFRSEATLLYIFSVYTFVFTSLTLWEKCDFVVCYRLLTCLSLFSFFYDQWTSSHFVHFFIHDYLCFANSWCCLQCIFKILPVPNELIPSSFHNPSGNLELSISPVYLKKKKNFLLHSNPALAHEFNLDM